MNDLEKLVKILLALTVAALAYLVAAPAQAAPAAVRVSASPAALVGKVLQAR